MVIHGHIQNGVVVPNGDLSLPDGTEVTITVCPEQRTSEDAMSADAQTRYLNALSKIDTVASENPDDTFSGTDHDQALYGGDE